jgi:predicted branched-subunit amino acid permease
MVDESYAVAIARYSRQRPEGSGSAAHSASFGHWYALGTGLTLWVTWQASTAAGLFLGAQVPSAWSLEFTLPLTFIALAVPALRDAAAIAAAVTAGVVAMLAAGLPYKLGLMLAALLGITAGLIVERRA